MEAPEPGSVTGGPGASRWWESEGRIHGAAAELPNHGLGSGVSRGVRGVGWGVLDALCGGDWRSGTRSGKGGKRNYVPRLGQKTYWSSHTKLK